MSTTRAVASNTAVQVVGAVAGTGLSLATVVLIARYLGPSGYGKYSLAWVFLSFFSIFADLGLVATAVREMAAYPEKTEELLGNILTFRLVVSSVILGCACSVGLLLPYPSDVRLAIALFAIAALLNLLTSALATVFRARLQMQYSVAATTLGGVAGLATLALVVTTKAGFFAVLVTPTISAVVTLGITVGLVRRRVVVKLLWRPAKWRHFLYSTILLGIALAVNQVYLQADTVLLSWYRPYTQVGFYGLAGKVFTTLIALSGFFVASVFPVLSLYIAAEDARLRLLTQKAFDVLTAVSLPLAVGGAILAPQIVALAGGRSFAGAAAPLRVLFGALIFTFLNNFLGYALVAKDQASALLKLTLFSLAANVLANIVIIPRYGPTGAAATTLASEAMVFAVVYVLMRRSFGFAPHFTNTAKAAIAASIMGVAVYFAREVTLAALVPAGMAIYSVLLGAMGGGLDRSLVSDLRRGDRA